MTPEKISKSLGIVVGVGLIFLVQNTLLVTYSTYLLAILIIFSSIYISLKKRSSSKMELFSGNPVELFGLSSIIMLIISLTSGLSSPLFFFLYFLLFILAFIAPPVTIWVFLASIILFFIPEALKKPSSDTFIKLASLILLSPISYFIGMELDRRNILNRKIKDKTGEIIQDAQILKEEDGNNSEQSEEIEEIIEEAESLRQDTGE